MDICVGWLLDTRVSWFGYYYCFFIAQVSKKFSFDCCINGPLLGLRQFLTTEIPLKNFHRLVALRYCAKCLLQLFVACVTS